MYSVFKSVAGIFKWPETRSPCLSRFSDWAGVQNATALIADPTIPVQVTCTAVAGSTGSVSVVPESVMALAICLSVSRCR